MGSPGGFFFVPGYPDDHGESGFPFSTHEIIQASQSDFDDRFHRCSGINYLIMQANKKYLTRTPLERFFILTAGFAGGYMVTESLHMALAVWADMGSMLITLRFAGFILWAGLFIVALIARKAWKIWLLYLFLTALFAAFIHFGK